MNYIHRVKCLTILIESTCSLMQQEENEEFTGSFIIHDFPVVFDIVKYQQILMYLINAY